MPAPMNAMPQVIDTRVVSSDSAISANARPEKTDSDFDKVLAGQVEKQKPVPKDQAPREQAGNRADKEDPALVSDGGAVLQGLIQQLANVVPVVSAGEPVAHGDDVLPGVESLVNAPTMTRGALLKEVPLGGGAGAENPDVLSDSALPAIDAGGADLPTFDAGGTVLPVIDAAVLPVDDATRTAPVVSDMGHLHALSGLQAQVNKKGDPSSDLPIESPVLSLATASTLDSSAGKLAGLNMSATIAGSEGEGLPLIASLEEKAENRLPVAGDVPAKSNIQVGAHHGGESESARPVAHIAEPVGSSRWGEAVAQRVGIMLGKQEQQIDMQLNPPHLGPMEVRLNLGGEQASVVFSSQHAAVREALAAATPKLTALLADQGIHLTDVQVASDSLQQHQQQAAQQQSFSNEQAAYRSRLLESGGRGGYASAANAGGVELRVPVARSGVSLYV